MNSKTEFRLGPERLSMRKAIRRFSVIMLWLTSSTIIMNGLGFFAMINYLTYALIVFAGITYLAVRDGTDQHGLPQSGSLLHALLSDYSWLEAVRKDSWTLIPLISLMVFAPWLALLITSAETGLIRGLFLPLINALMAATWFFNIIYSSYQPQTSRD